MKRFTVLLLLLFAASVIPSRADGWFPKVNTRGEITSGFGMVEALGHIIEGGWGPQWIDDDTIVFGAMSGGTVIYNVRTGDRQHLDQQYSQYAAGGGQWIAGIATAPFPVQRYRNTTRLSDVSDAGAVFASPDGGWGYLSPYQSVFKSVTVNGVVVATGNVMQASLSPQGLVYTVATGIHTRAVLVKRTGRAPFDSSIFNWEGSTSCDGPDDIWVLSVTQKGLAFRKAGAADGFYWRGEHFNPSCAYVGGQFVIAFSTARGDLGVYRVAPDASAPRVRYATVKDDCVDCEAPTMPPPAPPVLPPPPVVEPPAPPQALPDPVRAKAIVVEERAKYPAPSMSALHIVELLKNVARRLNAEGFEGGPFGVLVKNSGSNCAGYSCDIICVGNGSSQKQWDVLGNADPVDGPPDAHGGTQSPGWDGPLGTIAVRTCEVPSGGTTPPQPPAPTCGWPDQRVLVAQLSDANDAKARRIATLNSEKASCESHAGDIEQQLIAAKAEIEAMKAKPAPTCTAKVETPWARSLGAKASCTINR